MSKPIIETPTTPAPEMTYAMRVRIFARETGLKVSDRGAIAQSVKDAYEQFLADCAARDAAAADKKAAAAAKREATAAAKAAAKKPPVFSDAV
jgi:hypothetical protein